MDILYTATVSSTSGREGKVASDDGKLDLKLTAPKETGGSGEGTNPEQLFAAGYSACFSSALGAVARKEKIDVGAYTITAKVSLGKTEENNYQLAVELLGSFPALSPEQAEQLMNAAHQVCPYSRATRDNIDVKLTVGQ